MATTLAPEADARTGRSLWGDAVRRIRRDPGAMACLAVIVLYGVVAVGAPIVYGDWEKSYDYDNVNAPPSLKAPFGTDALGRSVVQKTLMGAHVSMTVALFANLIAVPLGMILGAIAGYYGKWVDDGIVWFYTTVASIPGIIRLIALQFAFQDKALFGLDLDGMTGLVIVLATMSWIGTCRLVRAETMKIRELDYVLAARATGRRGLAILLRHVLPNVLHIGIIQFSLGFIGAIKAEVILSYLNLGVKDLPSWGKMINEARMDLVVGRSWEVSAAVGAIFFIVLALNIFGDRLRDAFDPRLRTA